MAGRDLAMGNVMMKFFGVKLYEEPVLAVGPKKNPNPFIQNNIWANLRKGIEYHLGKMEEQIKASGGPFLLGERFTLADCAVIPFFQRGTITGWLDELAGQFPIVEQWWADCKARPAYSEWVPKYGGPLAPHCHVDELAAWIKEQRAAHPKFDAVYKGTYEEYSGE